MNALKELRINKKITQKQACELLGISLRSYKSYENEDYRNDSFKYRYMLEKLSQYNIIDEEHGILSLEDITNACKKVFDKYEVGYCYLFGSYARSAAGQNSDVDLLVSCDINGLQFFGMVEELREALHKRVDVLNIEQLKDNLILTDEILRDGIRVYVKSEK